VLTLGGMVEVKVPAGTQPDAKLVLRGKGIKDLNSIHRYPDKLVAIGRKKASCCFDFFPLCLY
jgi:DnaJ-class molecular chaperone